MSAIVSIQRGGGGGGGGGFVTGSQKRGEV